ncbi:MAG: hypothetical protein U0136_16545 [Bdellovibrionota bacterium]
MRLGGAFTVCGIVLSAWLPAWAESPGQSDNGPVAGIFDGFEVGGAPRHTPSSAAVKTPHTRPSKAADSFAIQPANPSTDTSSYTKPSKSNHPQQDIIPTVDSPTSRSIVETPSSSSDGADAPRQAAAPTQITPAYFQSIINQAKGVSGSTPTQSKYKVTDDNRF